MVARRLKERDDKEQDNKDVQKTIKENLSPKEIKLSIQDWKGDYHRV